MEYFLATLLFLGYTAVVYFFGKRKRKDEDFEDFKKIREINDKLNNPDHYNELYEKYNRDVL